MKVFAEKDSCSIKEDDDKKVETSVPERERHDSVDSEPMLTIDDSGANNDHEEHEITDPTIASELRILELAEQLEERLLVAFLHSKVTIVCSIQYVCDCELFY